VHAISIAPIHVGVLAIGPLVPLSNYGIPFPGTFLIDRAGEVTSRFFEEAYQERNTISTIMIALGNAKTPLDDRLCFTPRSLPLSYTVKVRQLDTERTTVPK
jgi:hypothetical protein